MGMFGVFLKRMRRYKNYPRIDSYAPIYSLSNGDILFLMKFMMMKNNKIKIIIIDILLNKSYSVISDTLGDAWNIYKNEIIKTFMIK